MLLLGHIVAWLALVFGLLRLGVGFFVASFDDPMARAEAAAQYLGSSTSGEAMDQGIMVAVFGIVLGVMVKIGRAVSNPRNSNE